jgi:hypothetical protein
MHGTIAPVGRIKGLAPKQFRHDLLGDRWSSEEIGKLHGFLKLLGRSAKLRDRSDLKYDF